jgi:hypothetical protein
MEHTRKPILNDNAHTICLSGRGSVKKAATNRPLAVERDVEIKNGLIERLRPHDLKHLAQRARSVGLADLQSVQIKLESRKNLPMMIPTSRGPKGLQPLFRPNHSRLRPKVRI